MSKIISKPEQPKVIDSPFPLPWKRDRPIWVNFDLWSQLNRPQRDLLLLRTMSWLSAIRWFKPDLYQGLVACGVLGAGVELMQGDAVGVMVAAGLSAIAGTQIWRASKSSRTELAADEAAIRIAGRRGYTEADAARHLLAAIEAVPKIEGRPNLDFNELLRSQNLRVIAGLSPVGVPEKF